MKKEALSSVGVNYFSKVLPNFPSMEFSSVKFFSIRLPLKNRRIGTKKSVPYTSLLRWLIETLEPLQA